MFPASVNEPVETQLPHAVEPSSASAAKLASCLPAASRPLISRDTSESDGDAGFCQVQAMLSSGSGALPPSFSYSSRIFRNSRAIMSWSRHAWPGGSTATFFHCAQRDEFTNAPSFSAKHAAGRRKTSVLIADESSAVE